MNTPAKNQNNVVEELASKIKEDPKLGKLIELSLKQASSKAKENLESKMYKALTWPTTIKEYLEYLTQLSRYTPNQWDNSIWQGYHDEVEGLTNHFYWLINQKVGEKGSTLQDHKWFCQWVDRYAKSWGSFLDTSDSFNDDILKGFMVHKEYRIEDSMIEDKITKTKRPNLASGWLTFNQFFSRTLNPGLRPIDSPMDNFIVTSPADCIFKATYELNEDSTIPEIIMKRTHKFSNVEDLLQDSQYKSAFAGGTFAHYYLAPYSYHRLHFPVSGLLKESYPVKGLAYLNVTLKGDQLKSIDQAEGGYEFVQARGILIIDTKDSPYGDIGIVGVVPVGMSHVSSVNMTAQPGHTFLKGDEFGYFLFGGSDIIVLFQKGVNPQIDEGDQYRHYGTRIAVCNKK